MPEKVPNEHIEQVQFVQWFRLAYPQCFIFAIPNGEYRAMTVAKRLKAEGVVPGVPDLMILTPSGKSIFVEMKRQKGGSLSAKQKDVINKIERLGFPVSVCKGALDAKKQIEEWLGALSS